MELTIASDHAGFELKGKLIAARTDIDWHDLGPSENTSVDYPDFAHKLIASMKTPEAQGILICGSGQGMAMTANKSAHIRAALCWTSEIALLARQHNNANVLCLPARFVDVEHALGILNAFVNTSFAGGRHQRRVDKISVGVNDE